MKDTNRIKYLYHGLTWLILGVLIYWRRQELMQWGWGIFWPVLPFILGLLMIVEHFRDGKKSPVMAGAFLAGTGGFSLLFSLKILSWQGIAVIWPFVFFLAGFIFFLAFLSDFSDYRLPVPALFLTAAGFFSLSRNNPAMAGQLRLYAQVLAAAAWFCLSIVFYWKKRRSLD